VVGKKSHLPAGLCIGHNVVISPFMTEADFDASTIPSGTSI
jgi:hypothetical protein